MPTQKTDLFLLGLSLVNFHQYQYIIVEIYVGTIMEWFISSKVRKKTYQCLTKLHDRGEAVY